MKATDVPVILRRLRQGAGLTVRDLAGRIGLTGSAITSIEKGRSYPALPTLISLLAELEQEVVFVPRGVAAALKEVDESDAERAAGLLRALARGNPSDIETLCVLARHIETRSGAPKVGHERQ
jgi:transcriptional regulator with XRE-family HTH domain